MEKIKSLKTQRIAIRFVLVCQYGLSVFRIVFKLLFLITEVKVVNTWRQCLTWPTFTAMIEALCLWRSIQQNIKTPFYIEVPNGYWENGEKFWGSTFFAAPSRSQKLSMLLTGSKIVSFNTNFGCISIYSFTAIYLWLDGHPRPSVTFEDEHGAELILASVLGKWDNAPTPKVR